MVFILLHVRLYCKLCEVILTCCVARYEKVNSDTVLFPSFFAPWVKDLDALEVVSKNQPFVRVLAQKFTSYEEDKDSLEQEEDK